MRCRYSPLVDSMSNTKHAKPLERLPQLNYSLLKENALRKKMVELGIPSGGHKALLIRRHTEWVNLVNANYDSSRPRTKRELLQVLFEWDRSQGRVIPNGLGRATNTNSQMRKDFDTVAWGTVHNKDFQRLIQEARQSGSRKLDGNGGPNLDNSADVETSEVVPIAEGVPTSDGVPTSGGVPGSEAVSYDDKTTGLEHLRDDEKIPTAGSKPGLTLADLNEG